MHAIYDFIAQILQSYHTWALFINLIPKFEFKLNYLVDFHCDEQTMLVVLQGIPILLLVQIGGVLPNQVPFGLGNAPTLGSKCEVITWLPFDYDQQRIDDLFVLQQEIYEVLEKQTVLAFIKSLYGFTV